MKQFLVKIAFFLLPLAVVLSVTEMYVRSIPNTYKYKYDFMNANAGELRTLVLGSSHAYRGLNPEYLPQPAFNLAYSSQDIKRDCFLLERFIGEMDSLEYVIMSLSYHSLPEIMEDIGQSKVLLKYYGIYMSYPDTRYSMELAIPRWIDKVIMNLSGEDVCDCDSLGFAKERVGRPITESDALSVLAYHTFKNKSRVGENMSVLEKMAAMLENKGAKLILITTPLTAEYFANMEMGQYRLMLDSALCLTEKFRNVVYLNYADDKRFVHSDFKDVDHLNSKGAEKLSVAVSDTIDYLRSFGFQK